jgi:hypothetical protein
VNDDVLIGISLLSKNADCNREEICLVGLGLLRPAFIAGVVALVSGLMAGASTAEIKVTTRLVLLNVSVHDRGGRPVDNLSKTDFEVTDGGRPHTIALFSVDRLAPGPTGAPATTLPRNIVTNRPVNQVGVPASVTVVLIDTYNTKVIDQEYTNRQLL